MAQPAARSAASPLLGGFRLFQPVFGTVDAGLCRGKAAHTRCSKHLQDSCKAYKRQHMAHARRTRCSTHKKLENTGRAHARQGLYKASYAEHSPFCRAHAWQGLCKALHAAHSPFCRAYAWQGLCKASDAEHSPFCRAHARHRKLSSSCWPVQGECLGRYRSSSTPTRSTQTAAYVLAGQCKGTAASTALESQGIAKREQGQGHKHTSRQKEAKTRIRLRRKCRQRDEPLRPGYIDCIEHMHCVQLPTKP
eukprot:1141552-Pelagomonas_calceolata.AAC.5